MKQFTETKFFRTLEKISQKGITVDIQILQNEYDEFVLLLLSENVAPANKATFFNSLVYTRAELVGLTEVLEKKLRRFMYEKLLNWLTNKLNG